MTAPTQPSWTQTVKRILDRPEMGTDGINWDALRQAGYTGPKNATLPLHERGDVLALAIKYAPQQVEPLLNAGLSVEVDAQTWNPALLYDDRRRRVTAIKMVLESGHDAATKLALLKGLLAHGARFDKTSESDDVVTILVNCWTKRPGPNGDDDACTLLSLALEHHAPVNNIVDPLDPEEGGCAFPVVTWSLMLDMPASTKLLVQAGADLHALDGEGKSLLHKVSYWPRPVHHTRWLLRQGLAVDGRDREGRTPLMCATRADVVRVLVEAGADLQAVDKQGRSVREHAQDNNVAKALPPLPADSGASRQDIDWSSLAAAGWTGPASAAEKDADGCTALMVAVTARPSFIESLLAQGADAHAVDKEGRSVLDHARKVSQARERDLLAAVGRQVLVQAPVARPPRP